jgi:thiol-disulfide isomerase/thioredoxin
MIVNDLQNNRQMAYPSTVFQIIYPIFVFLIKLKNLFMRVLITLLPVLALFSCTPKKVELKEGLWRGVIELQGQQLPFNFEVIKEPTGFKVYLKNGEEKLIQDEVSIDGDSVKIVMLIFDIELRAKINENSLQGFYYKNYNKEFKLPFSARFGEHFRFVKSEPATKDFSGTYALEFKSETETYPSVGIFKQELNHVTGTFLTPTGDYRYLEGNVVDDRLRLSTFDGNHAFLFTAGITGDSIRGDFYSGNVSYETWKGIKNENATMPDAESLTFLKPGFEKLNFSFPGLTGAKISPLEDRFKNKVLILQIFGTWCPNCMDETKFLATWYKDNKDRGVEILGMAYERKDDFTYASERVKKMKEKLGVEYDFVIAGTNDKDKASETLPALNRVLAFPTTIFIGKDGKVKHIHTGFTGPGTGIYYEQFKDRFNQIVNELLAENMAL